MKAVLFLLVAEGIVPSPFSLCVLYQRIPENCTNSAPGLFYTDFVWKAAGGKKSVPSLPVSAVSYKHLDRMPSPHLACMQKP